MQVPSITAASRAQSRANIQSTTHGHIKAAGSRNKIKNLQSEICSQESVVKNLFDIVAFDVGEDPTVCIPA